VAFLRACCDWSKPGVGATTQPVAWLSFARQSGDETSPLALRRRARDSAVLTHGWMKGTATLDQVGHPYGGIYISASLIWLWAVEGQAPTRTDLVGAALALAGAVVIIGFARSR
jgi:hypothetical protein